MKKVEESDGRRRDRGSSVKMHSASYYPKPYKRGTSRYKSEENQNIDLGKCLLIAVIIMVIILYFFG